MIASKVCALDQRFTAWPALADRKRVIAASESAAFPPLHCGAADSRTQG